MKFTFSFVLASLAYSAFADEESRLLRGKSEDPSVSQRLLPAAEQGPSPKVLAKLKLRDDILIEFEQVEDDIYIIMTVPKESTDVLNSLLRIEEGEDDDDATTDPVKLFHKLSPNTNIPQGLVDARETTYKKKMSMKPKANSFQSENETPEESSYEPRNADNGGGRQLWSTVTD